MRCLVGARTTSRSYVSTPHTVIIILLNLHIVVIIMSIQEALITNFKMKNKKIVTKNEILGYPPISLDLCPEFPEN